MSSLLSQKKTEAQKKCIETCIRSPGKKPNAEFIDISSNTIIPTGNPQLYETKEEPWENAQLAWAPLRRAQDKSLDSFIHFDRSLGSKFWA